MSMLNKPQQTDCFLLILEMMLHCFPENENVIKLYTSECRYNCVTINTIGTQSEIDSRIIVYRECCCELTGVQSKAGTNELTTLFRIALN